MISPYNISPKGLAMGWMEYSNDATERSLVLHYGNYGRLVQTVHQPLVTTFADGRRITNSYDDGGTLVARTVRTGGRLPRTTTEKFVGPHVGPLTAKAFPTVARSFFDGGYFDAEGKVHYFVTDYQGNVVEDRKARGAVVASTHYYPYGEPWTEPAGDNDRWFGGKERLAAEGLPMSDFGPRLLNHAYPTWLSQDRKLEDYYHLSPYSYCAGNPIRYVDPTGAEFTESAQNAANRLFSETLNKMDGLKNKKWGEYSIIILELLTLGQSSQLYDVENSEDCGSEGFTTYNLEKDAVTMTVPDGENGDIGLLAHEFKHAAQFENGEIDLAPSNSLSTGAAILYDVEDEVEAYNRGKIFGGISVTRREIGYYYNRDGHKLMDKATNYLNKYPLIDVLKGKELLNYKAGIQNSVTRYKRILRINGITYKPEIE